MGHVCVICGGGPTTDEHIWPRWLKSLTPHRIGKFAIGITTDPVAAVTWTGAAFEHRAAILCDPCNARLGDELESPTALLVRALLAQTIVSIPPADQVLLSRWLYKTALMVAAAHPDKPETSLPTSHYTGLSVTLDLPPGSTAWVGRLADRDQEAGYWLQRFEWHDRDLLEPPTCEGYAFALAVADVVGVVVVMDDRQSPRSKDLRPFRLGGRDQGHLVRIWPPSRHYGQRWPPDEMVTPAQLVEIHESFERMGGSGSSSE